MDFSFEKISGVVRALLAAGAGYLAATGFFDAAMVDQVVSAAMLLITVAWSWKSKAA